MISSIRIPFRAILPDTGFTPTFSWKPSHSSYRLNISLRMKISPGCDCEWNCGLISAIRFIIAGLLPAITLHDIRMYLTTPDRFGSYAAISRLATCTPNHGTTSFNIKINCLVCSNHVFGFVLAASTKRRCRCIIEASPGAVFLLSCSAMSNAPVSTMRVS